MNLWMVGFAIAIVATVGVSYAWYQSTVPVAPQAPQVPQWPYNAQLHDGVCVGSYSNNVQVAWPATNNTC